MDEKIKEIEEKYPNTTCCNLICFAEKLQSEQHIKELEREFKISEQIRIEEKKILMQEIRNHTITKARVKELERGIEEHRDNYTASETIMSMLKRDNKLYKLVGKEKK